MKQAADGTITLSMNGYLDRIAKVDVNPMRWKEYHSNATPFLGRGVLGPACFVGSSMQRLIPKLTAEHPVHSDKIFNELLELLRVLVFKAFPPQSIRS